MLEVLFLACEGDERVGGVIVGADHVRDAAGVEGLRLRNVRLAAQILGSTLDSLIEGFVGYTQRGGMEDDQRCLV